MGKHTLKGPPWLTRTAWLIAAECAILGSMGGFVVGLLQDLHSGIEDTGWILVGGLLGLLFGLLFKRLLDYFE